MSGAPPARRRDSARSRELLLQAATELFAERSFEGTTTREIGERAGVDPALIARYFGSKTLLYIAALRAEQGGTPPADLTHPDRLREVVERTDRRGPTPLVRVAVQALSDRAAQEATRAALHERLVEPLREHLEQEGADRPGLRAEITVAAVIGILLGRHSGAFDELSEVSPAELVALLGEALDGQG
ncbi:TetR family transcriptional regulator [Streptomyces sp. NPDC059740]|uniref:TetR/AcrR family transcriptional regulator n=1 Tax=Streptomyces sp. NPDC059740 TaxID=3346926 RepID=UPI00364F21D6